MRERRPWSELTIQLALGLLALLALLQLESLASEAGPGTDEPGAALTDPAPEPEALEDRPPPGEEPVPPADAPDEPLPGETPGGGVFGERGAAESSPDSEQAAPTAPLPPVASATAANSTPQPPAKPSEVVLDDGPEVPVAPGDVVMVADDGRAGPRLRRSTAKSASVRAAQDDPPTEAEIFPPGNPCRAGDVDPSSACLDFVDDLVVCRDLDSPRCEAQINRLRSDPCRVDVTSAACKGWLVERFLFLLADPCEGISESACVSLLQSIPPAGCPEGAPRTPECVAVEAARERVCARRPYICGGAGGTSEPTGPGDRDRPRSVLVGLFDPGGRGDAGTSRLASDRPRGPRPRRSLARTGLDLERAILVGALMVGTGLALRRRRVIEFR